MDLAWLDPDRRGVGDHMVLRAMLSPPPAGYTQDSRYILLTHGPRPATHQRGGTGKYVRLAKLLGNSSRDTCSFSSHLLHS